MDWRMRWVTEIVNIRWRTILYSVVFGLTTMSCSAEKTATDGVFRVHIEGESAVALGQPLFIKVSFNNGTSDPVALLKWGTPLEQPITRNIFNVMHDGQRMPYIGFTVKRGEPQEDDFILIEPGQSVSSSVDVATAYRIDRRGDYQIRLRPEMLQFGHSVSSNVASESFSFVVK